MGLAGSGVIDAAADGGNVTCAVIAHDLDGQDVGIGVCTHDAEAIVTHGGSDAGAVRAMAVAVHAVAYDGCASHKVPAMHVVHIAVVVIILIVRTVGLTGIGPDVVLEVGVGDVHTRVEDGDDGTLGLHLVHCPQLRQFDGIEAPLLVIHRFVDVAEQVLGACALDKDQIVRLSIFDLRQCLQCLNGLLNRHALLLKLEAEQRRQVRLDDLAARECFGTTRGTPLDGTRQRHQFVDGGHSQAVEHLVNLVDARALELAFGAALDLQRRIGLELDDDLSLAVSLASPRVHTVHLVVVVVAHHLRHGRQGQAPQQQQSDNGFPFHRFLVYDKQNYINTELEKA